MQLRKFLIDLYDTLFTSLVALRYSKFSIKLPQVQTHTEVYILGNGPSVVKVLHDESKLEILKTKNIIVVNKFPATDYYTILKPTTLVLIDPAFFLESEREDIIPTYKAINKSTTWKLNIVVPVMYMAQIKKIIKNENINLVPINAVGVQGFSWFKFYLIKKNIAIPSPQTVLIAAITYALNSSYASIVLAGVEHNWLNAIGMDENNKLYIDMNVYLDQNKLNNRFYYPEGLSHSFLDEIASQLLCMNSYKLISEYNAKCLRTPIINTTLSSYIEVFDKVDIIKILK